MRPKTRGPIRVSERSRERAATIAHGLWLLVPGLWLGFFPSHYRRVHDVQRDYWIERVHSMWLSLVGGVILAAGVRGHETAETQTLSLGSSLGLAAADIAAAKKTGLARIYFVDLAGQLLFALLGLIRLGRRYCSQGRG